MQARRDGEALLEEKAALEAEVGRIRRRTDRRISRARTTGGSDVNIQLQFVRLITHSPNYIYTNRMRLL